MVRRTFLFATALFAATACSPAKAPETAAATPDVAADVAKLKSIEDQWYTLYHAGDAAGIAGLYSEDAHVLAAGAPAAVGKAAIQAYLVADIASTKAAGLSDDEGAFSGAGASGDLGWVSGAYVIKNAAGGSVDAGKYTTVFQRINGEWKIIRDTWNSDAAPAAAPSSAVKPKA